MPKTYGLGMGEAAATGQSSGYDRLVSGGAGDCIIIAVCNPAKKRIYMVHAHRLTPMADVLEQINTFVRAGSPIATIQVRLASQIFGQQNPQHSQLVQAVRQGLNNAGYVIAAEHNASSLSLDVNGNFVPAANAQIADRPAATDSNAVAKVAFQCLDPSLVSLPGGGTKAKESPI